MPSRQTGRNRLLRTVSAYNSPPTLRWENPFSAKQHVISGCLLTLLLVENMRSGSESQAKFDISGRAVEKELRPVRFIAASLVARWCATCERPDCCHCPGLPWAA